MAAVVAYAGNELRGYGNLVLIKHADGWIIAPTRIARSCSCKRGEQVAPRPGHRQGRRDRRGQPSRSCISSCAAASRRSIRASSWRRAPSAGRPRRARGRAESLRERLAEPAGKVLDELPGDAAGAGAAGDRPFAGLRPRADRRRQVEAVMRGIAARRSRDRCPGRHCESRATGRTGRTATPSPRPPRPG